MSHYVTNEHPGPEFPCSICNKNVLNNVIECCLCNKWIHAKCGNLCATDLKKITDKCYWTCINCKKCFPFYNLTEDELFFECGEEMDNLM